MGLAAMPRPRKRGPGACAFGESRRRETANGAPRGARTLQKGVWQDEYGRATWRSIPHGFVEGHGREDGLPGAAKNTGDFACPDQ
jgi:hypothetical protein